MGLLPRLLGQNKLTHLLEKQSFQPTEYDPVLWLDASDLTTITQATGVSQWDDKSGNGNHATQGTGAAQPTYTSGNKVTFDGTDDSFACTSTARSFFFVVSDALDSDSVTPLIDGTSSNYVFLQTNSGSYTISLDGASANTGDASINGGSLTPGDGSGENIAISGYVPFPNQSTKIIIFFQMNSVVDWNNIGVFGSFYGGISISEIIGYNDILTTTERQAVEAYLTAKWL